MLYLIGRQDKGYHSKSKDGRGKYFLQPTIQLNIVKAEPLFIKSINKKNDKRGETFYAEIDLGITEFYKMIKSLDISDRFGEPYCLTGTLTDYGIIPGKPFKREPLKDDIGISFMDVPKDGKIIDGLELLVNESGGKIFISMKK